MLALRALQQNSRSHEIRFVREDEVPANTVDQVTISGSAKQMAKDGSATPQGQAKTEPEQPPMPNLYGPSKR